MTRPMKVAAVSDLHCGAHYGLTPPQHWCRNDLPKQAEEMWNRLATLHDWGPDVLLVLGDCIEGKGVRQGGRDIFEPDRDAQGQIACACLKYIKARNDRCKVYMVHGTPAHVGTDEDFETPIARDIGAEWIKDHGWCRVSDVCFGLKHKISGGMLPYTRGTALRRERLLQEHWHLYKGHPLADVHLRGHTHFFDEEPGIRPYGHTCPWLAISLPALAGLGGIYGARQCANRVDFGWVCFECDAGAYDWSGDEYVYPLEESIPQISDAGGPDDG